MTKMAAMPIYGKNPLKTFLRMDIHINLKTYLMMFKLRKGKSPQILKKVNVFVNLHNICCGKLGQFADNFCTKTLKHPHLSFNNWNYQLQFACLNSVQAY